jgi:osmotically-inducible protein OsmY
MKTDTQLKTDVTAELAWDAGVNPTRIGVAVKNGIVTLSGEVDTVLQKHAVERAVRRVGGVRGMALDLQVHLAPAHQRTDADIAQAALYALDWHSFVPQDRVKVAVEDGWVTLTGELDWGYQSASAEQCIRPLVGVTGVTNNIRLTQRVNPETIRTGIDAALARHAKREAKRLAVEVDGDVVTLRGDVGSMAERKAAVGTAFAAKGVSRVIDKLEVVD